MFAELFYALRREGVPVSIQEWLAFLDAVHRGLVRENLDDLYHVGRALLVKHEARFDAWDRVFLALFEGVTAGPAVTEDVLAWLADPVLPRDLTPEELERIRRLRLDLEELRREFEKRLLEQKERHDGGSHWIGTGGTSPFGSGGVHPHGVRVGEGGGGRAVQVATQRRFRNYRSDLTLDVRSLQVALKKLRRLRRSGPDDDLDVEESVDATCKNAGELELRFHRPRKNEAKLLLLMDAGGSMTPHAHLVSTLFSAAHGLAHWKEFRHYHFHNCVYETLWKDLWRGEGVPTADVLRTLPGDTMLVLVGDATMAPSELTQPFGAIDYWHRNDTPGIVWLHRLADHFERAVWLNPLPPRWWDAPSLAMVHQLFPMFPLTLDGIEDAVTRLLRGDPAPRPTAAPGSPP